MPRLFKQLLKERLPYLLLLFFSVLLLILLSILTLKEGRLPLPLSEGPTAFVQQTSSVKVEKESKATLQVSFPVHITGAVKAPGVYWMQEGQILDDLIKEAGGFIENPPAPGLNLASPLKPHMSVHQPLIGEALKEGVGHMGERDELLGFGQGQLKVHVNEASVEELMALPGIGEQIARAIVKLREEKGGFESKEDLLDVPGIKSKRFEQIEPFISLHP